SVGSSLWLRGRRLWLGGGGGCQRGRQARLAGGEPVCQYRRLRGRWHGERVAGQWGRDLPHGGSLRLGREPASFGGRRGCKCRWQSRRADDKLWIEYCERIAWQRRRHVPARSDLQPEWFGARIA